MIPNAIPARRTSVVCARDVTTRRGESRAGEVRAAGVCAGEVRAAEVCAVSAVGGRSVDHLALPGVDAVIGVALSTSVRLIQGRLTPLSHLFHSPHTHQVSRERANRQERQSSYHSGNRQPG